MIENLSVSWDEYQKNICKGLGALQQRGEFVDMTLAADGHHVKVHQMVLSLVSPFIKDLITSANCPHPVIFLNRVSYKTMQAILEYAYSGEVLVSKDNLGEFLEACKDLHIKGLQNMLNGVHTTVNDSVIPSKSKKRKKSSCEEIAQITHDDDIQQTDVTDEVQMESVLSDEIDDKNDFVASANECKNVPKVASLKYSVSTHSNLQIILNRYLYSFIRNRKNNQRYWRCINQQNSGCLAYVTTVGDNIQERGHPHNHTYHDAQILKKIKNGNMFTCIKEVEEVAAAKKKKREEADLLNTLNDKALFNDRNNVMGEVSQGVSVKVNKSDSESDPLKDTK